MAITTALVIGARYLPFLDDPWDLTIGSINGAVYTAGIERTYQAVGFWRLRGMPHLQHLPSSPAAAWPNSHYINHPPLFHWATHVSVSLCGDTERGYRMLPVILTATAAVLLVMIVAYAGSRAATIAAALVTVTIPVNFLHGWIPGYEPAVAALGLFMFLGHLRLRTSSLSKYWLACVPLFLGVWIDWIAVTFVLSVVTYEALQPAGNRCVGKALLLIGSVLLALVSIVVLFSWWLGGVDEALGTILATGGATSRPAQGSVADALRVHLSHWPEQVGWPLIMGAAAGLVVAVRAIRRVRDPLAVVGLSLLWPGLMNVLLFSQHAALHDFWLYYCWVPTALLVSLLFRELWRLSRLSSVLLICTACLLTGCQSWTKFSGSRSRLFVELSAAFEAITSERDLLVFAWPFSVERFYLDRASLFRVTDANHLDALKIALGAGKLDAIERIVCVVPDTIAPLLPDIATRPERWGVVYQISWDDLVCDRVALRGVPGPNLTIVLWRKTVSGF